MIEKMKSLIRDGGSCVLATAQDNQPHCSLMSYITNEDCSRIYMMSLRETMKYRNLLANGAVSMLIDTRDQTAGQSGGQAKILALTIHGLFEEIADRAERDEIFRRLLARHPRLSPLARRPDADVFAIRIKSLELLDGVIEAKFALMD
jgi:nitroimidazol reductase NimA-like FMN-containing flavoprotein (pyridoxamine 5'-phosphate oxidase superfamily)